MGANTSSSIRIDPTPWSLDLDTQQSSEFVSHLFATTPLKSHESGYSSHLLWSLNQTQRRRDLELGPNVSNLKKTEANQGPSFIKNVGIIESLEMLVLSGAIGDNDSNLNNNTSSRRKGNKVSEWLLKDAVTISELRPSPVIYYNAVVALGVHSKLMKLRSEFRELRSQILPQFYEMAMIASTIAAAQIIPISSDMDSNSDSKKNSEQSLSLSVAIGIKLFFKLLRSLQRAGHVHGLLRLASSLPPLLEPMNPRALAAQQKPLRIFSNENGDLKAENRSFTCANDSKEKVNENDDDDDTNISTSSESVVAAVWQAVEELSSLDPNMLGVDNHASTLSALLALAVKRGELHPLLIASGILLFGPEFSKPTPISSSTTTTATLNEEVPREMTPKTFEKGKIIGPVKRYAVEHKSQPQFDSDLLDGVEVQDTRPDMENKSANEHNHFIDATFFQKKQSATMQHKLPVLASLIELKTTIDHAPELLWQTPAPIASGDDDENKCEGVSLGTPWWTADWSPAYPGQSRAGSGFLMTFGKSDHGKLGHGMYHHHSVTAPPTSAETNKRTKSSFVRCDVPKAVRALCGVSLKRIHSLSTHSIALTETGSLLSWGNGERYRLGHGSEERELFPRLIASLRHKPPVTYVACGLAHTIALLNDGEVLSWGNGGNGRLGVGDTCDRSSPSTVAKLRPNNLAEYHKNMRELHDESLVSNENMVTKIATVSCGASHSIAIDQQGCVWTWGKNNQGQCGLGHTKDVLSPNTSIYVTVPLLKKQHQQDGANEFNISRNDMSPARSPTTISDVATPNEYRGLRRQVSADLALDDARAALNDGSGEDMVDENMEAFPVGNPMAVARRRSLTNAQTGSVTPGSHHLPNTLRSDSDTPLVHHAVGDGDSEELSEFDRLLASPTTRSPGSYLRQSMGLPEPSDQGINEQAYADAVNAAAVATSNDPLAVPSLPPKQTQPTPLDEDKGPKENEPLVQHGMFVSAAAGWEHSLFLTASGQVWSCGGGYKETPPVLGHGGCKRELRPKRIQSLGPDPIREMDPELTMKQDSAQEDRLSPREHIVVHIACGWDHSLAVTRDGECLSWGAGQHGKLGHGDEKARFVPTVIEAFQNREGEAVKIVLVEAGCEHSAAVTAQGHLYTWGNANSGRLGHGNGGFANEECMGWSPASSMNRTGFMRDEMNSTQEWSDQTGNNNIQHVGQNTNQSHKEDECENEKAVLLPRLVESLALLGFRVVNLAVGDKYNMILVRPPAQDWETENNSSIQIKALDGTWLRKQSSLMFDPYSNLDENVTGERAALMMLSQLERLITKQVLSVNNCNTQLLKDKVNDQFLGDCSTIKLESMLAHITCAKHDHTIDDEEEEPTKVMLPLPTSWPFILDSSVGTFELLLSLLKRSLEKVASSSASLKEPAPASASPTTKVQDHSKGSNKISSGTLGAGGGGGLSTTNVKSRGSSGNRINRPQSSRSVPGSKATCVPSHQSTAEPGNANPTNTTVLIGPVGGLLGEGGKNNHEDCDEERHATQERLNLQNNHSKMKWIAKHALRNIGSWGSEGLVQFVQKQQLETIRSPNTNDHGVGDSSSTLPCPHDDGELEESFVSWSVIYTSLRLLRGNIKHLLLLASVSAQAINHAKTSINVSKSFKSPPDRSIPTSSTSSFSATHPADVPMLSAIALRGGSRGDSEEFKSDVPSHRDSDFTQEGGGEGEEEDIQAAIYASLNPTGVTTPHSPPKPQRLTFLRQTAYSGLEEPHLRDENTNESALSKPASFTRCLHGVMEELHYVLHAILVAVPLSKLNDLNLLQDPTTPLTPTAPPVSSSQSKFVAATEAAAAAVGGRLFDVEYNIENQGGYVAILALQKEAVACIQEAFPLLYPSLSSRIRLLRVLVWHISSSSSTSSPSSTTSSGFSRANKASPSPENNEISTNTSSSNPFAFLSAGLDSPLCHPWLLSALIHLVTNDQYLSEIMSQSLLPSLTFSRLDDKPERSIEPIRELLSSMIDRCLLATRGKLQQCLDRSSGAQRMKGVCEWSSFDQNALLVLVRVQTQTISCWIESSANIYKEEDDEEKKNQTNNEENMQVYKQRTTEQHECCALILCHMQKLLNASRRTMDEVSSLLSNWQRKTKSSNVSSSSIQAVVVEVIEILKSSFFGESLNNLCATLVATTDQPRCSSSSSEQVRWHLVSAAASKCLPILIPLLRDVDHVNQVMASLLPKQNSSPRVNDWLLEMQGSLAATAARLALSALVKGPPRSVSEVEDCSGEIGDKAVESEGEAFERTCTNRTTIPSSWNPLLVVMGWRAAGVYIGSGGIDERSTKSAPSSNIPHNSASSSQSTHNRRSISTHSNSPSRSRSEPASSPTKPKSRPMTGNTSEKDVKPSSNSTNETTPNSSCESVQFIENSLHDFRTEVRVIGLEITKHLLLSTTSPRPTSRIVREISSNFGVASPDNVDKSANHNQDEKLSPPLFHILSDLNLSSPRNRAACLRAFSALFCAMSHIIRRHVSVNFASVGSASSSTSINSAGSGANTVPTSNISSSRPVSSRTTARRSSLSGPSSSKSTPSRPLSTHGSNGDNKDGKFKRPTKVESLRFADAVAREVLELKLEVVHACTVTITPLLLLATTNTVVHDAENGKKKKSLETNMSASESLQVLETITDSGIVPLLGGLLSSPTAGDLFSLHAPKGHPPTAMLQKALRILEYDGQAGNDHENLEQVPFDVRMSVADVNKVIARSKRAIGLLPLQCYHKALRTEIGLAGTEVTIKEEEGSGKDMFFCDAATAIGVDYLDNGISFNNHRIHSISLKSSFLIPGNSGRCFGDLCNAIKLEALTMGTHKSALGLLQILSVQAISIDCLPQISSSATSTSSTPFAPLSPADHIPSTPASIISPNKSDEQEVESSDDIEESLSGEKLSEAVTNQVELLMDASCSVLFSEFSRAVRQSSLLKSMARKRDRVSQSCATLLLKSAPYAIQPWNRQLVLPPSSSSSSSSYSDINEFDGSGFAVSFFVWLLPEEQNQTNTSSQSIKSTDFHGSNESSYHIFMRKTVESPETNPRIKLVYSKATGWIVHFDITAIGGVDPSTEKTNRSPPIRTRSANQESDDDDQDDEDEHVSTNQSDHESQDVPRTEEEMKHSPSVSIDHLEASKALPCSRWVHVCCSLDRNTIIGANTNPSNDKDPITNAQRIGCTMNIYFDGLCVASRNVLNPSRPQKGVVSFSSDGSASTPEESPQKESHEGDTSSSSSLKGVSLWCPVIADLCWHGKTITHASGTARSLAVCGVRSEERKRAILAGHSIYQLATTLCTLASLETANTVPSSSFNSLHPSVPSSASSSLSNTLSRPSSSSAGSLLSVNVGAGTMVWHNGSLETTTKKTDGILARLGSSDWVSLLISCLNDIGATPQLVIFKLLALVLTQPEGLPSNFAFSQGSITNPSTNINGTAVSSGRRVSLSSNALVSSQAALVRELCALLTSASFQVSPDAQSSEEIGSLTKLDAESSQLYSYILLKNDLMVASSSMEGNVRVNQDEKTKSSGNEVEEDGYGDVTDLLMDEKSKLKEISSKEVNTTTPHIEGLGLSTRPTIETPLLVSSIESKFSVKPSSTLAPCSLSSLATGYLGSTSSSCHLSQTSSGSMFSKSLSSLCGHEQCIPTQQLRNHNQEKIASNTSKERKGDSMVKSENPTPSDPSHRDKNWLFDNHNPWTVSALRSLLKTLLSHSSWSSVVRSCFGGGLNYVHTQLAPTNTLIYPPFLPPQPTGILNSAENKANYKNDDVNDVETTHLKPAHSISSNNVYTNNIKQFELQAKKSESRGIYLDDEFMLRNGPSDPRRATQSAAASLPAALAALETLTGVEDCSLFAREGTQVSVSKNTVFYASENMRSLMHLTWMSSVMNLLSSLPSDQSLAVQLQHLACLSSEEQSTSQGVSHCELRPCLGDLIICLAEKDITGLLLKVYSPVDSSTLAVVKSVKEAESSDPNDDGRAAGPAADAAAKALESGTEADNELRHQETSTSPGSEIPLALLFIPPHSLSNIGQQAFTNTPAASDRSDLLSDMGGMFALVPLNNVNAWTSKEELTAASSIVEDLLPRTLPSLSWFLQHPPTLSLPSMTSIDEENELSPSIATALSLSTASSHEASSSSMASLSSTIPPSSSSSSSSTLSRLQQAAHWLSEEQLNFEASLLSTRAYAATLRCVGLALERQARARSREHLVQGEHQAVSQQQLQLSRDVIMGTASRPSSAYSTTLNAGHRQNQQREASAHGFLKEGILPHFLEIACMDISSLPTLVLGSHEARVAKHLPALIQLSEYLTNSTDLALLESLAKQLWDRLSSVMPQARSPWMRAHNQALPHLAETLDALFNQAQGGSTNETSPEFPVSQMSTSATNPLITHDLESSEAPSMTFAYAARSRLLDTLNSRVSTRYQTLNGPISTTAASSSNQPVGSFTHRLMGPGEDPPLASKACSTVIVEESTAALQLEVIGLQGRKIAEVSELASIEGWRVRALGAFPTLKLAGCSLEKGIWYYEVVLLTDGLMQIGWASSSASPQSSPQNGNSHLNERNNDDVTHIGSFVCDPLEGTGCGDHIRSWSFDGFRRRRWNVSSSNYGERWKMGDVLGCLLNLEAHEVRFALNGRDLGVAYGDVKGEGFYPCISLNSGQAVRLNFGHSPFLHTPLIKAPTSLNNPDTKVIGFRGVAEAPLWSPASAMLARIALAKLALGHSSSSSLTIAASPSNHTMACGAQPLSFFEDSRTGSAKSGSQAVRSRYTTGSGNSGGNRNEGANNDNARNRESGGAGSEEDVRRQNLVENLIGMGFPIDWAIRAADQCDVNVTSTLRESLAIAWIIDRMELEHAKTDGVEHDDSSEEADEEYEEEDDDDDEEEEEDDDEDDEETDDEDSDSDVRAGDDLHLTRIGSTLREIDLNRGSGVEAVAIHQGQELVSTQQQSSAPTSSRRNSTSSSRKGSASSKKRDTKIEGSKRPLSGKSKPSSLNTPVVVTDSEELPNKDHVVEIDVGILDPLFVDTSHRKDKSQSSSDQKVNKEGTSSIPFPAPPSLDRQSFLAEQGWEPLMSENEWMSPALIRESFFLPNINAVGATPIPHPSADGVEKHDGLLRWLRIRYLRTKFQQHVQQTHLKDKRCFHSYQNLFDNKPPTDDTHTIHRSATTTEPDSLLKLASNATDEEVVPLLGVLHASLGVLYARRSVTSLLGAFVDASEVLTAEKTVSSGSIGSIKLETATLSVQSLMDALMAGESSAGLKLIQFSKLSLFRDSSFLSSPAMGENSKGTSSQSNTGTNTTDPPSPSVSVGESAVRALEKLFACEDRNKTTEQSSRRRTGMHTTINSEFEFKAQNHFSNYEMEELFHSVLGSILKQSFRTVSKALNQIMTNKVNVTSASVLLAMQQHHMMTQKEISELASTIEMLKSMTLFWSSLVTDAATQIEKAQTSSFGRVPWTGPSRVLLSMSESDASKKPNLEWAVWILNHLISLASQYSFQFRNMFNELSSYAHLIAKPTSTPTNSGSGGGSGSHLIHELVSVLNDFIASIDLAVSPLMVEHLCYSVAYSANVQMRNLVSQLLSYAFEIIQIRVKSAAEKAARNHELLASTTSPSPPMSSSSSTTTEHGGVLSNSTDKTNIAPNTPKRCLNHFSKGEVLHWRDFYRQTCASRYHFPNIEKQLVVNLSAKLRKDASMLTFIGLSVPPLLCRSDPSAQALLLLLAQWFRLRSMNTSESRRLLLNHHREQLSCSETSTVASNVEVVSNAPRSRLAAEHLFTLQLLDVGSSSVVVGWGRLKHPGDGDDESEDEDDIGRLQEPKIGKEEEDKWWCEREELDDNKKKEHDHNLDSEGSNDNQISSGTNNGLDKDRNEKDQGGEAAVSPLTRLFEEFVAEEEEYEQHQRDQLKLQQDSKKDSITSKEKKSNKNVRDEVLALEYRSVPPSFQETNLKAKPAKSEGGDWVVAVGDLSQLGSFQVDGLNPDTKYEFRLRPASSEESGNLDGEVKIDQTNRDIDCVFSRNLKVRTSLEAPFMLNVDAAGPNLRLCNGGHTVSNSVNKQWNAVRATTGWNSGTHYWEVHIDKCISKNIFVGIMCDSCPLDNYVGSDRKGWGYLANKAIWHNKGKLLTYGELFKEGDTIGVSLDLTPKSGGSLSFTRNGRVLGDAIEGLLAVLDDIGSVSHQQDYQMNVNNNMTALPHGLQNLKNAATTNHRPLLYPAFSLYNRDDQLSLLPSLFPSVINVPKPIAQSTPSVTPSLLLPSTHFMGTSIAYSLISLVVDLVDDTHYFISSDKRSDRNRVSNGNDQSETKLVIPVQNHQPMSSLEERSLVGVFDWWRRWRTGVHIPITNHHGEIVWCCTARQDAEHSGGEDEDSPRVRADDDDEDAGKVLSSQDQDIDDVLNAAEEPEEEEVISMLGLSSGDVIEITKPNVGSSGPSSPNASPASLTSRALVLGHSDGLLWVLPSSSALLSTTVPTSSPKPSPSSPQCANPTPTPSSHRQNNADFEGVLLRTSTCVLCGRQASSVNMSDDGMNHSCACLHSDVSSGSVLWLRGGGFSVSAESWSFRTVMDLLSKQGSVTIVNPPIHSQSDQNKHKNPANDNTNSKEGNGKKEVILKFDFKSVHEIFSGWLPSFDEGLVALIELSLQAVAVNCMSGEAKSAITIAAHRSMPLHLPYDFVVRATHLGERSEIKMTSKRCGLFPIGDGNAPIPAALKTQWNDFMVNIRTYFKELHVLREGDSDDERIMHAVRMRVAFVLKLNYEVISSNRLIDWSLIQSDKEIKRNNRDDNMFKDGSIDETRQKVGEDDDGDDTNRTAPSYLNHRNESEKGNSEDHWYEGDDDDITFSPAHLLYTNRFRLLPRTKCFILSQMLLASTPTQPQHLLCPLLSWELLRGASLPCIVSPPSGLARQFSGPSSKSMSELTTIQNENNVENDEGNEEAVDEVSDLLVPFSKLYFPTLNDEISQKEKLEDGTDEGHLVSISIKVDSLQQFIYQHQCSSSAQQMGNDMNFNEKSAKDKEWTLMQKSCFGQLMSQVASLDCHELRHQKAHPHHNVLNASKVDSSVMQNKQEKSAKEAEEDSEPKQQVDDKEDGAKPERWLAELQPRSLDVTLKCEESQTNRSFPSAVVWRSLLYSICREVHSGNVALFCRELSQDSETNLNNKEQYNINRNFLQVDLLESANLSENVDLGTVKDDDVAMKYKKMFGQESCISNNAVRFASGERSSSMVQDIETARIGWYVGFGQVMGMAVRTGVKLPLDLDMGVWRRMVRAINSVSSSSSSKPNHKADSDHHVEEEIQGMADGLVSILPQQPLMLLSPQELEQLICLHPSIAAPIMDRVWLWVC